MIGAIGGVTLVAERVWGDEGDLILDAQHLERGQGIGRTLLAPDAWAKQRRQQVQQKLGLAGIHR
jgi:hypothetical protein